MRFWKKLVIFIVTFIAIILSCSRYYIVRNNFLNSLENSKKQNTNQYILEKYMLESEIIKQIQLGEEVTNEKIVEYLESLNMYTQNSSELVLAYEQNLDIIYSNINNVKDFDINFLVDQENDIYCFREINDKKYMVFLSNWSINNKFVYIINAYDIDLIYKEKDRQMSEILITDIIILIISTIIISIFSLFLTKPINNLNKISKKISSGEFDQRISIKSKDEIGELANSFNIMATQIEKKINELNLQVKQKNDFINGFTHELKTPMTAIVGYSDLLRLKKCDEQLTQKALNYIYSEAKRLEKLSFKLMRLMSLTEEKIEMDIIEINSFIEKISKLEEIILKENKIVLQLEKAYVICDSELLEVVIRNLIENANKAEPKNNIILIKGSNIKDDKYRISIIDTGRGIPKEHLDRVTEDFYMIDKSRSRNNLGSGIGLSLVKKILNFHDSEIYIESEENIGTTVYFDLKKEGDKK